MNCANKVLRGYVLCMLVVNKKKSIRLKNRTKYFDRDSSRSHVRFSSPASYQSRQIKIEGYESRLYHQFDYCQVRRGQTFFYTLTYNERALPRAYGVNCFDYEDIRDLLTGGFRKMLFRRYGTKFKYFVGAELGEGKGVRGMHNNPHYHILFFLEPAPWSYTKREYYDVQEGFYQRNGKVHKKGEPRFVRKHRDITVDVPYKKITPEDFRHLVRLYWQGFDEETDGYRDYNEAKYGIAREGENLGLVSDFRACMYCAKYVCKDVELVECETEVERTIKHRERERAKDNKDFYKQFVWTVLYPMFNTPQNAANTLWCFDDKALFIELFPLNFKEFKCIYNDVPDSVIDVGYIGFVRDILEKYHLHQEFSKFLDSYIAQKVSDGVSEWRNRYCNKCRISQGVGLSALDSMDKMNPVVKVPDGKKGWKYRPICQYYYRKLFTDVIKPKKFSPTGKIIEFPSIRVLNDLGIRYKCAHLQERLDKMAQKAANNLQFVLCDRSLFDKMKESDVNTSVFYSFDEFLRLFNKCNKLVEDGKCERSVFESYALYKLVYEDRFFKAPNMGADSSCDFPDIFPDSDYERFLVPSVYSVSRSDLRLDSFLDSNCEGYLPYSQHPYFLRFLGLFGVLDLCADYFFVQKDDKVQRTAEEVQATKRFHSESKLKEFYSHFTNILIH